MTTKYGTTFGYKKFVLESLDLGRLEILEPNETEKLAIGKSGFESNSCRFYLDTFP